MTRTIPSKVAQKQENPILLTAPSIYNHRLCSELLKMNLPAMPFPVIETKLLKNDTKLNSILKSIHDYDYIALPSRNAIKSFVENAIALNIPLTTLQEKKYCAIGKDQEYLRSFGIPNIIKNQEASPQGIVNALQQKGCKNQSIVIFAPMVDGMKEPNVIPNFIDSLKRIGMKVARVDAYITKVHKPPNSDAIIPLINKGKIALIAFTSTAEIQALLSLVDDRAKLRNIPISCFGPYTYNNAIKLGLKPAFMAKDFSSFENYATSINEYLNPTPNPMNPKNLLTQEPY